jgi:hypothetical protein
MGRLWRRAPAWRLLLVTALAATALGALFPPARPMWVHLPGAQPPPPRARFKPQTKLMPGNGAILHVPPPGAERTGNIPFAGHLLPLPAGHWQTLVLARTSKPVSAQVEVFGRIETGALTGLLLALGSDPVANQPSPFNEPQFCDEANSIDFFVAPEPFGQDTRIHECWRLATFNPLDMAERGRLDGVLGRALARLEQMGVKFPDRLLLLHTLRSEPTGFLSTLVFLPDTRGTGAAGARRWSAWVRRYATALQEGFDGKQGARGVDVEPK